MDKDVSIYQCSFVAFVDKASVHLKFPCSYFLEWKTANNKTVVEGRSRPSAANSFISFE